LGAGKGAANAGPRRARAPGFGVGQMTVVA
jgi:hypothetical protein